MAACQKVFDPAGQKDLAVERSGYPNASSFPDLRVSARAQHTCSGNWGCAFLRVPTGKPPFRGSPYFEAGRGTHKLRGLMSVFVVNASTFGCQRLSSSTYFKWTSPKSMTAGFTGAIYGHMDRGWCSQTSGAPCLDAPAERGSSDPREFELASRRREGEELFYNHLIFGYPLSNIHGSGQGASPKGKSSFKSTLSALIVGRVLLFVLRFVTKPRLRWGTSTRTLRGGRISARASSGSAKRAGRSGAGREAQRWEPLVNFAHCFF